MKTSNYLEQLQVLREAAIADIKKTLYTKGIFIIHDAVYGLPAEPRNVPVFMRGVDILIGDTPAQHINTTALCNIADTLNQMP